MLALLRDASMLPDSNVLLSGYCSTDASLGTHLALLRETMVHRPLWREGIVRLLKSLSMWQATEGDVMALSQEMQDELGFCLAATDLGNLIAGDSAREKSVLLELLRNQLCILQVLAEMNGMSPNPKAYRDLLPADDGKV